MVSVALVVATPENHQSSRCQLWRRNCSGITWNNYVNVRNAAQETYAADEKEYNDGVRDTLIGTTKSHKWWSTLKTALFGVDVAVLPLLRPDGSLTHCPKEKAAVLLMCLMVNRVTKVLLCCSLV